MKTLALYSVLVIGWFATAAAVTLGWGITHKTSMRPDQPIEFLHLIHVNDLGMDCLNCHQYADKSIHAGIPDAEFCMQCHSAVATDTPEIQKLTQMYNEGKPVDWVRIYRVKPHVYFSHKRHVISGVECQRCHGPMEFMTTAQRVTDLGMGWCLDCHNRRNAPTDCNTCHK
ncbi:MAG: cytochrome c3 family protein [Candidatus Abyssubacteria bacterium]